MKYRIMHAVPRILALLYIMFITLFAMDAIGEGLLALLMHLIPTLVLVGLTAAAWKWEFYGGLAFAFAGIVFTIFFNTYENIATFLSISFPLFLISLLFILSDRNS